MKLTVKTLKGTHFEIRVNPNDTIMAVKKKIEEAQGKDESNAIIYPCGQQLLIHSGKVLKDESTLEENKVSEDGFLVVMHSKSKASGAGGASSAQPSTTVSASNPATTEAPSQAPSTTVVASNPAITEAPSQSPVPADAYGQAASNIVAGSNLEQMVNQLMDMGGGNWDKDTVLLALRAAYNNPERAVDYLYSGIPAAAEVAVPIVRLPPSQASGQGANTNEATVTGASPLSGLPNSSPLNMFPQGSPSLGADAGGGSLDFLRHSQQFQALRAMVQANPQILQPMIQELSKQNPQLLRLIQEHHEEFLQLINEPVEGVEGIEGDLFDDQADQELPQAIHVTPEEQEAIARLEAMGFERARVVEAFLACDRNEQLAANYLLEHTGDED